MNVHHLTPQQKKALDERLFKKSLKVIEEILDSPNTSPKVRAATAIWVVEMVIGKPKQQIVTDDTTGTKLAIALAEALKEAMKQKEERVALPPPTVEGTAIILGETVERAD